MKWLLALCLSSVLPLPSFGQHTSRKQSTSFATGNCLADSVNQTLVKLRPYADAILTFQYYYDNGGVRFIAVLWQIAGKTCVRVFRDCSPSQLPLISSLQPDTLFAFYHQQHIADLPKMTVPVNAPSHGMAYLIGVYLPGNTRFYNIYDYQRHLLWYPELPLLPDEVPLPITEDPRSIWLELLERIISKDIAR